MTGCIGILYSDSEFMDLTGFLILAPPVPILYDVTCMNRTTAVYVPRGRGARELERGRRASRAPAGRRGRGRAAGGSGAAARHAT
jgi:hypothetical protein